MSLPATVDRRLSSLQASILPRAANGEYAASLLGAFVLVVTYLYLAVRIYPHYLLVGDDPANVAGTLDGAPLGWFTNGMRGYFHVYPEWPQNNFSDFYRPIWNLVLYTENAVFGRHYFLWFAAFCAAQYLGMLLFLKVLRSLCVPPRASAFFTVLFLINPAFVNFGLVYPGFQFDVLASLLLLVALFLLLKGRHSSALITITLATFMKETAIFAPVAAAATVFILRRDMKWSLLMLTPLLLWGVARSKAFGTVIGGTFASPSNVTSLLVNIAKGLAVWPSGALHLEMIRQAPSEHLAFASGYALLLLLLLLAANLALGLILIQCTWQIVRLTPRLPWTPEAAHRAILLTWMLCAIGFCVLSAPQARYGANVYMFLLLFFAYLWAANPGHKTHSVAAVIILLLVTLWNLAGFLLDIVPGASSVIAQERSLYEALAAMPQDGHVIYVANAPAMYSAPKYLGRAWGLTNRLVFINQFVGCSRSDGNDWQYDFSHASLSAVLPACATIAFSTASPDIQIRGNEGNLSRPGIGLYHFSDSRIDRQPGIAVRPRIRFGRRLEFRFDNQSYRTILVYNWKAGTYQVL